MPNRPAGWYDAADDSGGLWWWDGARWTHDHAYVALSRIQSSGPAPEGDRVQVTGPITPLR